MRVFPCVPGERKHLRGKTRFFLQCSSNNQLPQKGVTYFVFRFMSNNSQVRFIHNPHLYIDSYKYSLPQYY